jgi:hypothetical protein
MLICETAINEVMRAWLWFFCFFFQSCAARIQITWYKEDCQEFVVARYSSKKPFVVALRRFPTSTSNCSGKIHDDCW